MENNLKKDIIKKMILENEITLTDVVDVVIEMNGIIGVGLITLGEYLEKYCTDKIKSNQSN